MMRPIVLASLLAACHGSAGASTGGTTAIEAISPAEGRWRVDVGTELERTCVHDDLLVGPDREYVLTSVDDASFTLSPVDPMYPLHECTRDGADFDCPPVLVVGECTDARSLGFRGTFESDTRATGSIIYHFSCSPSPADDGTSGGTEPLPPDCCSGFGAVNPCTITVALVASWTTP